MLDDILLLTSRYFRIEKKMPPSSIALYITICLWSPQHPKEVCNEIALTPGTAGNSYASVKACEEDKTKAFARWQKEAGEVFGFTNTNGNGYRIFNLRCANLRKLFDED